MSENSKISWTDHTFNPWWGCVKVSPACDHCYAESFSKRVGNDVWGVEAPRRFFGDKHWNEPLKWNKTALKDFGRPARVFCASMADVFEDREDLIAPRVRLAHLISNTQNLCWNLLTKRYLGIADNRALFAGLENVHFGVTVENQTYDHRIVPGVSWISAEPLLGPLDLRAHLEDDFTGDLINGPCQVHPAEVNWVIVGGESGAGAREMKLEWAVDLIQQCKAAGVAVHFKQLGDVLAKKLGAADMYYDTGIKGKDGSPKMKRDISGKHREFWPAELQIQEFPVSAGAAAGGESHK